ncbi:hypothetical protein [Streptomyces globosus]|uniref:hypothetical protein n=1 Tax=Streptomyces globosus TaxID=68209 RepID=UPI0038010C9F
MRFDFDENEPQDVRDARLAAERAATRAARNAEPVRDFRGANVGTAIVAAALVALGWFGRYGTLGVVAGVFACWFGAALAWFHSEGDRGRHAVQRAYKATFGWGDGF